MCADRRSVVTTVNVLLWTLVLAPVASAQGAGTSQATLPLDEILRLYRESEAHQGGREAAPPTTAAVQRVALNGRLLDDSVIVDAQFEVAVLSDGVWIEVPLLRQDPELSIPALPRVEGATLAAENGALRLATSQKGHYHFVVTLIKRARVDGSRRSASIELHSAMPAELRIRHDTAVFRLVGNGLQHEPDCVVIHPQGARLVVAWARVAPADKSPADLPRVPIEPVITEAHASVVSTLEGRPITRVHYALRFSGKPQIDLRIPPGQRVDKLFVNGNGVPFSVDSNAVRVAVQHARAGDESADLELVLLGEPVGYNLSGRLHQVFPAASWTINQFYAELYLPAVFNYTWSGGSLAPVETVPSIAFTDRIPQPGKRTTLHQFLVAGSAPAVDVDYTIDLQGQYFTAR